MNISLTPPPQLLTDSRALNFRSVGSQSVNLLRLTIIAFSLTLLIACGGGGGGGSTAATRTPTPMDGPDMPSPTVRLETLPSYDITSVGDTRTRFSGGTPTTTGEEEIVGEIQSRATVANVLLGGDLVLQGSFSASENSKTNCSGTSCSVTVPDGGDISFSLSGVRSISPIDATNLVGFNSEIRAVMVDDRVTLVESISAARQSDSTRLAFQSYGGWLENSVFGVDRITVPVSGGGSSFRIFPYSFGNTNGTNPTGTARAVWRGIATAMLPAGVFLNQGDVEIDIDDFSDVNVDVTISNIRNINSGGSSQSISWDNISLTNGRFESKNDDRYIEGRFYGTDHTEVGGVFHDSIRDFAGAFGATRQP